MKNEDVFNFVRNVFLNDKTVYGYHGEKAKDREGEKPEKGKRWNTPSEMAETFVRNHFPDRLQDLYKSRDKSRGEK